MGMSNDIGLASLYLVILLYLIFLLSESQVLLFLFFIGLILVAKASLIPRYIDIEHVIIFAFIITFLAYWYMRQRQKESFTNDANTKEYDKLKVNNDDDKDDDADYSNDDDENEDDDNEVGQIDFSKTFLEAYQNLDSKQINSMTSETQKLIETQKQLMDTLKTLTPVVKQGKELMDGFKGEFGD